MYGHAQHHLNYHTRSQQQAESMQTRPVPRWDEPGQDKSGSRKTFSKQHDYTEPAW